MRILLDAAPSEGNGNPVVNIPVSSPPPAAAVVLTGTKSERETGLETEIAELRESSGLTIRQRETRIAELEDELHRLKETLRPVPAPAVNSPKRTKLTFFDED
jgi:hypothetical protein